MADVTIQTGMIILWAGAVLDIPEGFHLCDGTNGTPDLRDRFVVGAGQLYSVNDTGGSATHTHTASGELDNESLDVGTDINAGGDYSDSLASDQVTVTVDAANNMPPYYALAFIMKL